MTLNNLLSLAFVFIAQALLNAVQPSAAQTYAVCIACTAKSNSTDPCLNIRNNLTTGFTSSFRRVLNASGLVSYSDSWMYERSTSTRQLTGSTGRNYLRSREAQTTVTCRKLCSTYPDCSAWCPKKPKRRELVGANSLVAQPDNGDGNDIIMEESNDRVLQSNESWFIQNLKFKLTHASRDVIHLYRNYTNSSQCKWWLYATTCTPVIVQIG